MIQRVTGLEATSTYILVPRVIGMNILKCKCVQKVKRRPDGTPLFKSRLVVKGCSRSRGLDYFDTYAPIAKQVEQASPAPGSPPGVPCPGHGR